MQLAIEQEQIDPIKVKFNKSLKTVLFVLRDMGGCGFYRCLQPAMYLRKRGLMNTITDVQNTTPEHLLQADLVVLQSPGSQKTSEIMNFCIQNNKPFIVEIDDYLNGVSPNNPGYHAWRPESLYLTRFLNCATKANAMIVTTDQLAREYGLYNHNMFVVPNYLNENKWDLHQTKKNDGIIRIGWAGGNAHVDDLKMISPVIQKLVSEYKGKLKFETMGLMKSELKDTFPMIEFDGVCPSCNFQGEIETWGGEQLDNFPQVLASHGWDIAVAPVIDNAFNNAKSDLKMKEYSAVGFPIVASSVTPYEEAQRSGCDVLLARTYEDWYNSLKQLIENADRRREMVVKNSEWVKQFWIEDNVTKYHEIFMQVIEQHKTKK